MQTEQHLLLKDHRVIKNIREEIKKFWEPNENENTAYQDIQDVSRAVLKEKLMAMSVHIKNTEISNK
jgi:predicted DNA binding CopG/RHH family protein